MATTHAPGRDRSAGRITAVIALVAGILLVLDAPVAVADPYGGTTTTTTAGDGIDQSCRLQQGSGPVGSSIDGTVRGVPPSSTVQVFFGGTPVLQSTTGEALAGATTTDLTFLSTVPTVEPGEYDVVVVGGTFTVACDVPGADGSFRVTGEVLSESATGRRVGPPVVAGDVVSRTRGEGRVQLPFTGATLPFTGAGVLLLVTLALVLLTTGSVLRRRARARVIREQSAYQPW